jgi:hypothetical protein
MTDNDFHTPPRMNNNSFPSPPPRIRIRATSSGLEDARLVADPPKHHTKKRQPNSGSFKPNASGNPKGRPKGASGAKATVRKALGATIHATTEKGRKKISIFEALVKKEIQLAADGDWRARRTVIDLAKWALAEVNPNADTDQPVDGSPHELTDAGRSIIEWFEQDIRTRDGTPIGEGEAQ